MDNIDGLFSLLQLDLCFANLCSKNSNSLTILEVVLGHSWRKADSSKVNIGDSPTTIPAIQSV